MRYSIIHHDVREKFNLTIAECIVCDSISKLSRLGDNNTTHKSNAEIGEFIGFDEKTIRRAKATLLQKGLIFEMLGGYGTTREWENSVTFFTEKTDKMSGKTDKMSARNGQNVQHTISNKDNKDIGADAQKKNLEPIIEVPVLEDGEERPGRVRAPKADISYREVFLAFSPTYPKNWNLNKTQIQAAKNLLEERKMPQIRGALKFHRENSDKPFCPSVLTPYDLDSKWSKLIAFKKNHG